MNEADALILLRKTRSLVFTTRDFAALANIGASFASQMLRRLAAKGRITRLYQGLWADAENPDFNPFRVVPFLTRPHPAAVSMRSALHLQGMIEQIPRTIDVVSTGPTKKVRTPVGDYSIHQIKPEFFDGYEFYREGDFLIASPEKALVDSAYFASRKGKRFSALPELSLTTGFSQAKVMKWVKKVPYARLRGGIQKRLEGWLVKPRRMG